MQAMEVSKTRLMNFRVMESLRKSFDTVCKYNGSNMTNELNRLIRTYIAQEGSRIIQEQSNVEELLSLIPQPKKHTQKSMVKNDWYDDSVKSTNTSQRHGEWILGDDKTWRVES